jgi:hypothetical protein
MYIQRTLISFARAISLSGATRRAAVRTGGETGAGLGAGAFGGVCVCLCVCEGSVQECLEVCVCSAIYVVYVKLVCVFVCSECMRVCAMYVVLRYMFV